MATADESSRLAIARRILLSAPPGQLETLLQDFETIFAASGDALPPEWVETVRADYNSSRTNLSGNDVPSLYEQIKTHQSEYYASEGVLSALSVTKDGDVTIIRTYAEKVDAANCTAGSWTAHWTLEASGGLKGTIKIQAFTHESASIQLDSTRDFGPAQTTSEKDVVNKLCEWEQDVVDSLSSAPPLSEKLKSLRRVMPVSRTKMEWNVLSHRMVKLLSEDTKE